MKTFLNKLIWVLILGTFLISVIPNIFSDYWLIDIFSNFKLQYLFIALVLSIIVSIVFKNKAYALVILFATLLWNGYFIAPYYIASLDNPTSNPNNFKLASINLLSSNLEIELVQNYIKRENPDVLVLIEFTPRWENELQSIIDDFPFKKLVTRTDNFGIALLSKFEMKSSVDYFGLNNKPSIIAGLNIKNQNFTVIATHPVPPVNQASFESRNQLLQNLLSRKSEFSKNLIIIGDLNTSSFSNHFDNLTKYHLKDSRIGFGLLPTWPADVKILQTTLDHCLVSQHLKVYKRETGEYIGSDHLPIHLTIGLN